MPGFLFWAACKLTESAARCQCDFRLENRSLWKSATADLSFDVQLYFEVSLVRG
jgi:hypothetical protein